MEEITSLVASAHGATFRRKPVHAWNFLPNLASAFIGVPHTPGMKPWTIADAIDLEVLLAEDEQSLKASPQARDSLHSRDRNFFLHAFSSETTPAKAPVFHRWLAFRREQRYADSPSPGQELQSVLRYVWGGLFLAGFLSARLAVWSFFRGAELSSLHPEPINVLWYAAVCIGLPLALTLLGFWVLIGSAFLPKLQPPAFVRGTLLQLLRAFARRAALKAQAHVPHAARWNAELVAGVVTARARQYHGVLSAELFRIVQAFGLAFTLGVVLFSWMDLTFYSRVFGWQSTDSSVTAESVHRVIRAVATPWSWLSGEAHGLPTLDHVRRTRYVRFQELTGFPPAASSNWARFLVLAAFTYGLLPRALLYWFTRVHARRVAKRPDFHFPRYDELWARLTTPHLAIDAPASQLPEPVPQFHPKPHQPTAKLIPCLLLIPAELNKDEFANRVQQSLAGQRNFAASETLPIDDNVSALTVAARIQSMEWGDADPRLVVVQESFMPPNLETLKFLKELGRAPIRNLSVYVALVGKPGNSEQAPRELDVDVWHDKVQSLGAPSLDVFPLTPPA